MRALSNLRENCASVGILALGSHKERHGVLPEDTDAKIASYIALRVALSTGAKFLGIVYSSHEFPLIETGIHQPIETVLREIEERLRAAKEMLSVKGVVIVNGHGGNQPIAKKLKGLEKKIGIKLEWDSTVVRGAHAGTEEFSVACALGMVEPGKILEHTNFEKYPEVGFVGLKKALRKYSWARKLVKEVRKGIKADAELGNRILEEAIESVSKKVLRLASVV